MQRRSLSVFFGLTFAFTWGLAILFLLFRTTLTAMLGDMAPPNPLFMFAVAGPTLMALVLTGATEGWSGLRILLSRAVRWRADLQCYVFVLLGIPLLGYCAALIGGSPKLELRSVYLLVPIALSHIVTDPGPLGEELGWRGYALPRLLARRSSLSASIILGLIWVTWHLPAFFIGGTPQSGLSLPAFLLSGIALSIIATWLYHRSQGGVLLSILLHWMANFSLNVLGAPLMPYSILLAAAALIVVVGTGPSRFLHPAPVV